MINAQVIISCMNQTIDIVKESNLSHDVLVINQCNISTEHRREYPNNILFIDSPSHGLSRSRNLAIQNSNAEICIISDDDEIFIDNIQEQVSNAYLSHDTADIIIFKIKGRTEKLRGKPHFLSMLELFHVCSVQITFRRQSICRKKIFFDINMGSGTGNGGGEEVDFLLRCYKAGLKIYYIPLEIAELKDSKSQWFSGYDEQFFYQRGTSTRHMLGGPLSILYAFYWLYSHRNLYRESISGRKALRAMIKGIYDDKIGRLENKRKV